MKENLVKEYLLENEDVLINVVQELNGWNGCLDWLEFWENDGYFFDCVFESKLDAVRATFYGDYKFYDDYVKINSLGNVVSYSEYDMIEEIKDSIDEIVENLIEYKDNICISDGNLEELLSKDEDE